MYIVYIICISSCTSVIFRNNIHFYLSRDDIILRRRVGLRPLLAWPILLHTHTHTHTITRVQLINLKLKCMLPFFCNLDLFSPKGNISIIIRQYSTHRSSPQLDWWIFQQVWQNYLDYKHQDILPSTHVSWKEDNIK